MSEQPASEQHTYRVSIGMQQRIVRAECVFDAAHKCGLGSGDLLGAEVERLDDNGNVIETARFSHGT